MLKLEGEITNNASNCKQLNTEINEKTGEVKEQKEKYSKLEHDFRLCNW